MPNLPYPSPFVTPGNGPNPSDASRYQVVKHPAAPKRLPYAIKDNATGGYVTGGSPHFPRVFQTKAEAQAAIPQPDSTNGWGDTYTSTVHNRNLYSNELARFRQKYLGHADDPNLVAQINKYDNRITFMNAHRAPAGPGAQGYATRQPAATPRRDPLNGWGSDYTQAVHQRNLYSNQLAHFRQKYPGHADDPNLVAQINKYDNQIAYMNAYAANPFALSPDSDLAGALKASFGEDTGASMPAAQAGRAYWLQQQIAALGGVPNRQAHGQITKAAPQGVNTGTFLGGTAAGLKGMTAGVWNDLVQGDKQAKAAQRLRYMVMLGDYDSELPPMPEYDDKGRLRRDAHGNIGESFDMGARRQFWADHLGLLQDVAERRKTAASSQLLQYGLLGASFVPGVPALEGVADVGMIGGAAQVAQQAMAVAPYADAYNQGGARGVGREFSHQWKTDKAGVIANAAAMALPFVLHGVGSARWPSPIDETNLLPPDLLPPGEEWTLSSLGNGRVGVTPPKYWIPSYVNGKKVYQRNDLIDPDLVGANGLTNLELMQEGYSPIGPDGEKIHLHHLIQEDDSPIAEVTQSFHDQYRRIIHIDPPTTRSRINRAKFNYWRQNKYWKTRAKDFQHKGSRL